MQVENSTVIPTQNDFHIVFLSKVIDILQLSDHFKINYRIRSISHPGHVPKSF